MTAERFLVVAPAVARVALDPHVGQEVHLDAKLAVAFALLAPPAGHVETEPPRLVAAKFRLGQLGEERADQVERPGERGRIGARRLAQGLLIDADHLVDLLDAADGIVGAGKVFARCRVRASDAYSTSSTSELLPLPLTPVTTVNVPSGILHVDVLEIVVAGAADFEPGAGSEAGSRGPSPFGRGIG